MRAGIIYGILFIFLLKSTGCNSIKKTPYFTGEITYHYTYESSFLNTDSLIKERPSKGIIRYDSYNYQSQYTGKDTVTYYYSGNLNKCLSQTGTNKIVECEDYGINTDSVLSFKIYPAPETVFGQPCTIVELQKKTSFVKYYVSNRQRVAPATYKKHKAYNWDVYGEKANGGLVLKLEHRFKNFIMKGTVTGIKNYDSKFKALEIEEREMVEKCITQHTENNNQ
jgi:hypothetical protein